MGCFLILIFSTEFHSKRSCKAVMKLICLCFHHRWFTMQRSLSIVCNMTVQYINKNNEQGMMAAQQLKTPKSSYLDDLSSILTRERELWREKRAKKLSTLCVSKVILYFGCIFHKQNRKAEARKVAWPFISISYVFRGGDMISAATANATPPLCTKVLFTNRNT